MRLTARLDRIANRQRKAHTGPVNVCVVYYEAKPDGSIEYTDSVTGDVLDARTVQPIAILSPGLLEAL